MTKKTLTFWPECFKLDRAVTHGPVAQLGERCVRIAEVKGSNPSRSTMFFEGVAQLVRVPA